MSSFNWKLQDNMNGQSFSNHLSNLRYNVCVRRESGYCSIEWGVGTSFEVRIYLLKQTSEGLLKL